MTYEDRIIVAMGRSRGAEQEKVIMSCPFRLSSIALPIPFCTTLMTPKTLPRKPLSAS